jgi:hypothetical protein
MQDGIQHFTADVAPAPAPNGHAAFALSLPAQQPPYFGGLASAGGTSTASSRLGPQGAAQLPGLPSLGDLHAASLQIPKAAADFTGGLAAAAMPNVRSYGGASLATGLHTGTGLQGHLQGSAAAAGFRGQLALQQHALQPASLLGSSAASAMLLPSQQQQQQQQASALQFGDAGNAAFPGGGLSSGLGGGLGSNQSLVSGSHGSALSGVGSLGGLGISHAGGSAGLSLAASSGSALNLRAAFSGTGSVVAPGGHQNALLAEHTEVVLADAHQAYRHGQFTEALTLCQAVSCIVPDWCYRLRKAMQGCLAGQLKTEHTHDDIHKWCLNI